MDSRFARLISSFLSLILIAAVVLSGAPAFADNPKLEGQAKAIQKKAMEEDYLTTEFAKAKDRLTSAISLCGDKCAAPLRAELKRDLGIVLIGGGLDKDKGTAAFADAMKLDPKVQIPKDLRTKELDAAWEAAKKGGGSSAAAATGGPAPAGDFTHTPVVEQQQRTPVPIYVEYAGEEKLVKVVARYKGFGMNEWKMIELKSLDKGWGSLVPCGDVQQGAFQYYLQGFNEANDAVATAGDRNNPFKVAIKREAVSPAPALPGQNPPTQCADSGDCPPDFPGCKKAAAKEDEEDMSLKDAGDSCDNDTECKSNSCKKTSDDPLDHGVCTEGGGKFKRIWVGAAGSFSMAFVPSSDDVCKLDKTNDYYPVNSAGYYCINDAGNDFPERPFVVGNNKENESIPSPQDQDKVKGGAAPAGVRLYGTFDYAINVNMFIGLRAGVVLGTYSGTAAKDDGKRFGAAPLHLELRATYVFGKDAIAKAGIAPYAFIGGGVSTWDSKVPVSVKITGQKDLKTVDGWYLGGPGFFGLGGGVRYAFSNRAALMGGLRVDFAFGPAFTPAFGPELAVQFGF